MLITNIYKKGIGKRNEDAYTMNEQNRLYAVMDGATGLDGIPGHIASYAVAKELECTNKPYSLLERVEQANQRVKEANRKHAQSKQFHDIPKAQRSSTGLAAIQLNEEKNCFDYVHAGDCMIFLQYNDGTIRTVTHDSIHALDSRVLQVIRKLQQNTPAQPLPFNKLKEKTLSLLIKNREKMNTDEGYGIIDGSEEAIQYLEYGRITLHKVKQVLLISDGLQIPMENEEENPWESTTAIAFKQGLPTLLDKVNEKEHADPNGVRYPRFKFSDDKTAILIRIS